MAKSLQIAPYELRFIPAQPNEHSTEATNQDHPWLVACHPDILQRRVFLGVLATHATKRRNDPLANCYLETKTEFHREGSAQPSVPAIAAEKNAGTKLSTALDFQNIWTFSFAHDDTSHPAPVLITPEPRDVASRLKSRFRKHVSPPNPRRADRAWRVGQVCRVRLDQTSQRIVKGRPQTLRGNLATLQQILPQWSTQALELPCLIVASDQPERELGKAPYRAVTVTPLIVLPDSERKLKRPIVTVPGLRTATGENVVLQVLTLLLFTVGYNQNHATTRVEPGCFGFPDGYTVPGAEMDRILEDIHRIIG